ncbi:MAG: hypothetical protein ACFFGZ_14900 [Candidatus Thorarchaeota archaeon]
MAQEMIMKSEELDHLDQLEASAITVASFAWDDPKNMPYREFERLIATKIAIRNQHYLKKIGNSQPDVNMRK